MRLSVSLDWLKKKRRRHAKASRSTKFDYYRDDPVAFAEEVLGLTVWSRQREILTAAAESDWVAVRSGHKVSKTTSAVVLALWWIATRPGPGTRVVLTAPSLHQVKNILWHELRKQWPQVRGDLGGDIPKDPRTGLEVDSGAQILGLSTDDQEKLAGVSGADLLFVIDEASGYPDELFQVIEGNAAGGAKVFAISNPTRPSGWFFEAHQGMGDWRTYRISSEETPNVVSGERLIPGLATRGWIQRMRDKYGPDYKSHRTYQIRVLGEFPETADAQVISLGRIEDAKNRWTSDDSQAHGRLTIGVDPAWYGSDDAVVQPARPTYAYKPKVLLGAVDEDQIADAVIDSVYELRRMPLDHPVLVVVDGVSAGAATVTALRKTKAAKRGDIVIVVNEGFRKSSSPKYANKRTEVWFGLNDWLVIGAIPPDSESRKELLAPRYSVDHEDRYVIEPKKRTIKRLGKSPNRADALTLAVSAMPESTEEGYEGASSADPLDDYDEDEDW
jgi:phage terminase large subunit